MAKKPRIPEQFVINRRGNLEVTVSGFPVEIRRFNSRSKKDWRLLREAANTLLPSTDILLSLMESRFRKETRAVLAIANVEGSKKKLVGLYTYAINPKAKELLSGYLEVNKLFGRQRLGTLLVSYRDAHYPGYKSAERLDYPLPRRSVGLLKTLSYKKGESRGLLLREVDFTKILTRKRILGAKKIKRKH